MTAADPTNDAPPTGVTVHGTAGRRSVYLYVGSLVALVYLATPAGGLMEVPISFFLKNKLHLSAHEVAVLRLGAALPLYLSVVFGFSRDLWINAGRGDRSFLGAFAAICAALYATFAFLPMDGPTFLIALVTLTAASLFVTSAQNGLSAMIGQQRAMTGQISVVWNSAWSVSTVLGLAIGGYLSDRLELTAAPNAMRPTFLVGAGLMTAIAGFALLRPAVIFDGMRSHAPNHASPRAEMLRLLRHRPIYPALTIWLMWCFAPGSSTPLQYDLQNRLGGSDFDWGLWNAIFFASLTPTFLLFGLLCRRWPLKTLLAWATLGAIPQFLPMLSINSIEGALWAAVPIGLMGGAATAAYLDLIIRSAPPGLQGSTLMMATGLYYIAARLGDIVGTAAFDMAGSFVPCVVLITATYALIMPMLATIDPRLTSKADNNPD
jgi:predicted MFS family arabinose efflux permease